MRKNYREQVNLIIDQGNASTKVAVYNEERLEASFVFKIFDIEAVSSLFNTYNLTQGIFSTVVDTDDELVCYLKKRLSCFVFLDETVKLPISIKYQTPQTLGKDRMAAVVGATYLYPNRNLLVIDAGTAITYELVDASSTFLGGNISPGMTTRFKALHEFTKKLPLLVEQEDVPLIGDSTELAIQAGVVNGIVFEMDGYIDSLQKIYPDLLVFLTGGHSFYFESRLKSSIFVSVNLVLVGLNRILEYNVENK